MASGSDPLIVLGVSRHATSREIRDAYLAAARRAHQDDPSGEQFRLVQWAYVTLTDPRERARLGLLADPTARLAPASVAPTPPGYRAHGLAAVTLPYAPPPPEVAQRRQRQAMLRRALRRATVAALALAVVLGSGLGLFILAAP